MNIWIFAFKLEASNGGLKEFLIKGFAKIEFIPICSHIECDRYLFVLLAKR